MIRFHHPLTALLVLSASPLASPASAQQVYTLTPPVQIETLLIRLERGGDRSADIRALGERDNAAPYLRHALTAAEGRYKRDLAEALRRIEARTWERNKKRFEWWAKCGRFDLCAELVVAAPTDTEATKLVGILTPELNDVGAKAAKLLGITPGTPGGMRLVPHEARTRGGVKQFSGDALTIGSGVNIDSAIIRADQCEIGPNDPCVPFVVVRSKLTHPEKGSNEWISAVVLVNNSMPLRASEGSVIVCDGDLTFEGWSWVRHSVIIANGSIRSPDFKGPHKSFLAATGSIDGYGSSNLYHAGGKVGRGNVPSAERVKANQRSLPFGVRFVDPREFGLELTSLLRAGVIVRTVSEGSVFAQHDVRAGDVIVQADGVRIDSPASFRRQLRRGVVAESVALRIVRDDKTITRIVFLDDVPAPQAPLPREVKP